MPYYASGVMMKSEAMSTDLAVPPQIPVGENDIISSVTITYEVR